jgi:hypothetical protein
LEFTDERGDPYPVQSPRWGEVLIMEIPTTFDPAMASSMRLRLHTPMPLDYLSRSLQTDTGGRSITIPFQASQVAMETGG